MEKFDAVVIGAGNGGLVAAIRLLQGGARVLVVEKHNIPGGFATSFRRGRFEFEASLHELNDFGTKENSGDVRDLFDSLGVTDKIEWLQIPEAYRVLSREEKLDATMPFGVQEFIGRMEGYVPGSRPSMEKFFALAKEIHAAQAYSSSVNGQTDSKIMVSKYGNFVRCGSYSVNEVLRTLKMPQKAATESFFRRRRREILPVVGDLERGTVRKTYVQLHLEGISRFGHPEPSSFRLAVLRVVMHRIFIDQNIVVVVVQILSGRVVHLVDLAVGPVRVHGKCQIGAQAPSVQWREYEGQ